MGNMVVQVEILKGTWLNSNLVLELPLQETDIRVNPDPSLSKATLCTSFHWEQALLPPPSLPPCV